MTKILKRKFHYHMAMFWCEIHRFAVKRFNYHANKHAEYRTKLDWGNEDAESDCNN